MRSNRKDNPRRSKTREAIRRMVKEGMYNLDFDFGVWEREIDRPPGDYAHDLTAQSLYNQWREVLARNLESSIPKWPEAYWFGVEDQLEAVKELIDEFHDRYPDDKVWDKYPDFDNAVHREEFATVIDRACSQQEDVYDLMIEALEKAKKEWGRGYEKLLRKI